MSAHLPPSQSDQPGVQLSAKIFKVRSYLTQSVVDVRHGLAGHPRVRRDGGHHVQGESQVGVPVHIDRVVPEVGTG